MNTTAKSATNLGAEKAPKPIKEGKLTGDNWSPAKGRQEPVKNNGRRECAVSRDSGLDTATTTSSNMTAKADHFTDIAEDLTADNTPVHSGPEKYPVPEATINLLTFEEIRTQYFQIQFADEGLFVDRIIPTLAIFWSRFTSEILGKRSTL